MLQLPHIDLEATSPPGPWDSTKASFGHYITHVARDVDLAIRRFLLTAADVPTLREGALYAMGLDTEDHRLRGKRLRALLCLATCDALGGDIACAMPFAVASELLHNLALIHDDIADEDAVRRTRPSLWKRYGIGHAVNIGDYLFSKALESILGLKRLGVLAGTVVDLIDLVVTTANRTIEGQALDISAHRRNDMTTTDYLQAAMAKTGYYLAAPAQGGAIIAGASPKVSDALGRFGLHIGPAFQILDDVLDLTAGKGRNEIGADIREGKRSLPVILASEACSSSQRERLFQILDRSRAGTTSEDVGWVIRLLVEHDAINAALAQARGLIDTADETLIQCPEALRIALRAASNYICARTC
jgi:geranylgeranyl pyrophosphate synthase